MFLFLLIRMLKSVLLRRNTFLFMLLALLLTGHAGRASHLLGGELTYRYLDAAGPAAEPFRYIVTVSVYINADSVYNAATNPFPSLVQGGRPQMYIEVYYKGGPQDGDSIKGVLLPRVSRRFATPQPQPGCPPTTPVRLCIYRATVNLPPSAAGYYAYTTDGTRNANIVNINTAAALSSDENMTLYAEMAPASIPNSSPTFADTAVVLMCLGDNSMFLNSATDADGDRLTYAFGIPYSYAPIVFGQGVRNANSRFSHPRHFTVPPPLVRYAPGYSLAQPFGAAAGTVAGIDPNTGVSNYRIQSQGRFVVAVDVSEFRLINGVSVLIGRTRRDLQLVVRACVAGSTPVLALASVTPRSFTVEEGDTVRFPVSATLSSALNPLVLKVSSALLDGPGGFAATFANNPGTVAAGQATGAVTVRNNRAVSGQFVFNTRCGQARPAPYDVLVTASSLDCRRQMDVAVYRITIVRPAPLGRIVGDTAVCDPAALRTYTATGPPRSAYRWRVTNGTIAGPATGRTVQVAWSTTARTGRLSVQAASAFRCPLDSVGQAVDLRPVAGGCAHPLIFPNIITPNNDRLNDQFHIQNLEYYPLSALVVLNRWGREVLKTADYRNDWGSSPDVPAGHYYYLLRLADGSVTKGWVEVMR